MTTITRVGYCVREEEHISEDKGVTVKTIVQTKYHPVTGKVVSEKTNLWNSRDGYVHREFTQGKEDLKEVSAC